MRTIGWYMGQRVESVPSIPVREYLLSTWLDGVADDQSGSTDEYAGHLFRVVDHLVLTDNDGNVHVYRALSVKAAEAVMDRHRLSVDLVEQRPTRFCAEV